MTHPKSATPQVLLLGRSASSFTDADWPAQGWWFQVQGACPEDIIPGSVPYPVRRAVADAASGATSVQVAAAWTKSRLRARRAQASPTWLWTLKRDPRLRRTVRTADVVVSLDVQTDRVLELVPDLWAGKTVVRSVDETVRGIGLLADLLLGLRAIIAERQRPAGLRRRSLEESELSALMTSVDPRLAAAVPGTLLPVVDTAEIVRLLSMSVGRVQAAVIVLDVLGAFRWEEAQATGESGLMSQQAVARLWLAPTEADLPSDTDLHTATEAALLGADLALVGGDPGLARKRLADAMTLMFHRERHAESGHSPLVTDVAHLLRPLYSSQTFANLMNEGEPRRLRVRRPEGERPRVLVLASASGQFHRPVVAALSEVAEVSVVGPELSARFLSRRGVDVAALDALSQLRQPRARGTSWDPFGGRRASNGVVRGLEPHLRRADVVWADWADRLTVWASHMVPEGVRFVLRINSLDALQSWFHLVKWSNVDQVLVSAVPLQRLVEQMLAAAGAEVPVTIVPNLIPMRELDQPKLPAARTTLGMIGWGRRVKDPLWALDLLAREPSWRLVLIGPGLHPPSSRAAAAYNDEVRTRLSDPEIADRVEFVGWTDDIAHELRRIGVILSTSRREGWHLGLVEGAASGAVPVVRDWPLWKPVGGAYSLFPHDWVVNDLDEAAARVRAVTAPAAWEITRRRAQEQARELFDPDEAAERYRHLILGSWLPD